MNESTWWTNFSSLRLTVPLILVQTLLIATINGQEYNLEIRVTGAKQAHRMELVNILVSPCDCGGLTNRDGFLQMKLAEGEYRVIASLIGFKPDTLWVSLDKDKVISISLETKDYNLSDILVLGKNASQNIERSVMGVQQLTANNIKLLPAAIGEVDVFRSMTMLPGVNSAGEASNGLSVRGGSLDQNLVLLDYAPIFNPTHLFGLFSVFTPDAIGGVDLYRANVPAKYGGRISSVVDVKMKNPDAEKPTLSGGLSFVASHLTLEAPVIKDKLNILASTRVSFNDFIFSKIKQLKNTRANFIDGTVKIGFKPNERNSFYFTGFSSYDFYELNISSRINTINSTSNQYEYATLNGTVNWLRTFRDKSFLRTTLVSGYYRPNIFFPQENSDNIIRFTSKIEYKSLQSEFSRTVDSQWSYSFGVQADQNILSPGNLRPGNVDGIDPVTLAHETSFELSAFAQVDWAPSEAVAMTGGLRKTHFLLVGAYDQANYLDRDNERISSITSYNEGELVKAYAGWEPRIGIRIKVSDNTSIKASFARTKQYFQNIYNSTTPLPTSRWKSSDANIVPQSGDTYGLGIYKNVNNNKTLLSIESYYRIIQNVLDYKPGADFFLAEFVEKDILQGRAKNYGVEFTLEQTDKNVNGWLNYTWSKSLRKFETLKLGNQINLNEWFNSDFDRPHVFNATINFHANEFNTFSFNFTYQTGRPYTIPNAIFGVSNTPVQIFLERNNSRLPDYHRFDFSWRIHNISTRKESRWKGDWIFTIYNLYSNKNAYNRYFGPSKQGGQGAYQITIFGTTIVSLTYSFKFA